MKNRENKRHPSGCHLVIRLDEKFRGRNFGFFQMESQAYYTGFNGVNSQHLKSKWNQGDVSLHVYQI